ncbi:unnamed protein product [Clonostachys rosea f. rosea IK726]|uniref:Uncharacterized protein n=1 Tax=Clonostachys rosea f. rosea IK726 TaxID=1349383 RepID=A0ACA9UU42_BIOOC|nr:unnamed protein product [Clonostachys rosea f. rosea IK726]
MLPKWSHNNRKKCLPNYPDAQLATDNEAYWEKMRPRDWDNMDLSDHHKPSEKSSLILEFKPKSGLKTLFKNASESNWRAMMRIRTKNVPRLMREGFFQLSPKNYCEGSSALRLDNKIWPERLGCDDSWRQTRTYAFKDEGDNPEWHATLAVVSKERFTIVNFDLGMITPDTISLVKAYNWNGEQVYEANQSRPRENFNLIYPNVVLGGWWGGPQPAPTQTSAVLDNRGEKLHEKAVEKAEGKW